MHLWNIECFTNKCTDILTDPYIFCFYSWQNCKVDENYWEIEEVLKSILPSSGSCYWLYYQLLSNKYSYHLFGHCPFYVAGNCKDAPLWKELKQHLLILVFLKVDIKFSHRFIIVTILHFFKRGWKSIGIETITNITTVDWTINYELQNNAFRLFCSILGHFPLDNSPQTGLPWTSPTDNLLSDITLPHVGGNPPPPYLKEHLWYGELICGEIVRGEMSLSPFVQTHMW